MTALLIDASQKTALLGLAREGILVKLETATGRSSDLLPLLKKFCDLKELDYIAVGTGPGSYMGLRTAATIAKTLSFALKVPLLPFASALAFLPQELSTVVGDAKMGELFLQEGDVKKGLTAATLIDPDELPKGPFLDLRTAPPPQLGRLAKALHDHYVQGNTIETNELHLHYLR